MADARVEYAYSPRPLSSCARASLDICAPVLVKKFRPSGAFQAAWRAGRSVQRSRRRAPSLRGWRSGPGRRAAFLPSRGRTWPSRERAASATGRLGRSGVGGLSINGVGGSRTIDMSSACGRAQVRRLATDARRVTSVWSGAFVLAAAGLLEGRRATTHWAECGLLDDTYTGVTVDPDAIYVHDGNVWTSAGVTAGIDLALALVADDNGHQAAATVARQLVVYLQRSGGQAQSSTLLAGQAADSEPVRDLL